MEKLLHDHECIHVRSKIHVALALAHKILTKCGIDGLNFCMSTPSSFFKKLSFSGIVLRSIRPAGNTLLCLKCECHGSSCMPNLWADAD